VTKNPPKTAKVTKNPLEAAKDTAEDYTTEKELK